MRHQKAGRHLSRTSSHRKAMFSNMVASLVRHERIETTEPKAKEVRRLVERTITWGIRVGDLVGKDPGDLSAAERADVVHAVRMAKRVVKDDEALHKVFHELATRFKGRPGGYTRLMKVGQRTGDAAPMTMIELLPAEAKASTTPKKVGRGASRKAAEANA